MFMWIQCCCWGTPCVEKGACCKALFSRANPFKRLYVRRDKFSAGRSVDRTSSFQSCCCVHRDRPPASNLFFHRWDCSLQLPPQLLNPFPWCILKYRKNIRLPSEPLTTQMPTQGHLWPKKNMGKEKYLPLKCICTKEISKNWVDRLLIPGWHFKGISLLVRKIKISLTSSLTPTYLLHLVNVVFR